MFSSDRRPCWAAAILGFLVRLFAIDATGANAFAFGDASDYIHTAASLCSQHIFPDHGNVPFFRAPLLPFFIAAVTACHPQRVVLIKVALACCDVLTCFLIGEIARVLFRSSRAALIATLVAALDPFFVLSVCDVRTEPLFMFLLTAAIWLLFTAGENGSLRAIACGAAAGLAALTRPAGLVFVPIALAALLVPFFVYAERSEASPVAPPRSRLPAGAAPEMPRFARHGLRWRRAALLAVGVAAALSPWIARNAVRYGELIVVNDAGGYNFWRGNDPELRRVLEIGDRAAMANASAAFEMHFTGSLTRALDARPRSPHQRSREFFKAGLSTYRHDPRASLLFALKKAWWYWRPWLNPHEYSGTTVLASGLFNVLLYAFAAIGLVTSWRRGNRVAAILALALFVVPWLAHIPFQVVMRFRIPFTDPLLIAFAAGAADVVVAA